MVTDLADTLAFAALIPLLLIFFLPTTQPPWKQSDGGCKMPEVQEGIRAL